MPSLEDQVPETTQEQRVRLAKERDKAQREIDKQQAQQAIQYKQQQERLAQWGRMNGGGGVND